MKSFHERLDHAMSLRRVSGTTLAKELGVAPQAIYQARSGKTKSLTAENTARAAAVLQVSAHWLATGEGDMEVVTAVEPTRAGEPSAHPDWEDFGSPLRLPAARAVPVVGTAQLGDNGHYVELEYPAGTGDGTVLAVTSDTNAYAVRCRGDSMQPRLQHGEFAVCEPNHEVSPGDEVLVRAHDGRVMIKRLRYQRDGRVYLDSINDGAHPPVILELAEIAAMHYVAAIVKRAYFRP